VICLSSFESLAKAADWGRLRQGDRIFVPAPMLQALSLVERLQLAEDVTAADALVEVRTNASERIVVYGEVGPGEPRPSGAFVVPLDDRRTPTGIRRRR
jgi:hypothetical protein